MPACFLRVVVVGVVVGTEEGEERAEGEEREAERDYHADGGSLADEGEEERVQRTGAAAERAGGTSKGTAEQCSVRDFRVVSAAADRIL